MAIHFKTANECFTDMKTQIVTEAPQLVEWTTKGVVRSILTVVAAAISILWDRLKLLYLAFWPQYADRLILRRYYEEWGMVWSDSLDTETARAAVLACYRQKGKGTKAWYRAVILQQFKDSVSDATVTLRARGPNTVDVDVSWNGGSVYEDMVSDIQDFFEQDENNVAGVEVLVRSV